MFPCNKTKEFLSYKTIRLICHTNDQDFKDTSLVSWKAILKAVELGVSNTEKDINKKDVRTLMKKI